MSGRRWARVGLPRGVPLSSLLPGFLHWFHVWHRSIQARETLTDRCCGVFPAERAEVRATYPLPGLSPPGSCGPRLLPLKPQAAAQLCSPRFGAHRAEQGSHLLPGHERPTRRRGPGDVGPRQARAVPAMSPPPPVAAEVARQSWCRHWC